MAITGFDQARLADESTGAEDDRPDGSDPLMLAALNIGAILLGAASGGLTASLLSLLLGAGLAVAGLEDGPNIGLVIGILAGLSTGGWVAGKRARHSARFHGAVTGLVLAFLVVVIARLGGSPAPTGTVLLLGLLSVVVSGLSGWSAGRSREQQD